MESKKILVAEDEQAMAHALDIKLTKEGYEVAVANNGEIAIDFLKKQNFDIVLLDIMMPKVDGFEVLKYVQGNKIKTPVVITSNLSQPEDKEKAKKMGAVDFFVKSDISINEIVAKVREIIG